ncbi:MAG: ROK family protein [Faecalibacterium sp.]
MLYLGIDLGGTNIKAALVTEQGEIVAEASRPTNLPRPAEAVCDDIAALVQELIAQHGPAAAVGIGCPGTVEPEQGIIRYSNNLAWENFAMREYLEQRLGLPVRIGNDANVAALGEALVGCAKGADSAVILTLGTGVGGGVVLNGKLWTGHTGAASEPGHMTLDPHGPLCTCGRRGCLEAYASATALIRNTLVAMEQHPESLLHTIAAQQGGVDGRTAFLAADSGDAAAAQVIDDYINALAQGIANLINVFYPEVIGLSGGVANQGERLLAPLRAAAEPLVFGHALIREKTRIVTCTLGYRAGVIGAAMLAREGSAL